MLSLLLLVSIVFVGQGGYRLWRRGPWELPKATEPAASPAAQEEKRAAAPPAQLNTKTIIEKNLFDPERGASRTKEAEAASAAMQRIRSLVLVGTIILGGSRYAILEGLQAAATPPVLGTVPTSMRLKLGDAVEGFKLSEVHEKKVVFTKGNARVDLALNFFRRVEGDKDKAPTQPRAPVPNRLPQPRLPRPGVVQPPPGSPN